MKLSGFIDSHLHVLGLGYVNYNIELGNCRSISEIIEAINPVNDRDIIIAKGWNQENLIEKRMPCKQDLDKLEHNFPVILTRVCGHVIVVNQKMLDLAGIEPSTKQVPGGSFDYESGIFSEKALALIYDKLPKTSKEDLKKYFIKANEILLENGVTSVASDDFSILPVPYEMVIQVMRELYETGLLQVKITEQVNLTFPDLQDFINKGYANKRFGKLRMGPLKILSDGSLGGRTAALNQAYQDDPGNFGILTHSDQELFELIDLADSNAMDVVAHAIGDRAVDQVLAALAKVIKKNSRTEHNHAIIHAQLLNKKQIDLMKSLNIGAIVQPIFLNSDIAIVKQRIGNRFSESYLFKTMYNKGINVGFSTDTPIEAVNPFMNIYTAISRKSIKDKELSAFLPVEAFELKDALKCYYQNNLPYVYLNELPAGDFIIIDQDLDELETADLLDVEILECYVDDVLVYRKEQR